MRLLLTRPRSESDVLAQRLTALGHEVGIEPLLSIVNVPGVEFTSKLPQAIIVTSINGARAFLAHARAPHFRTIPIYAVGATTAHVLDAFNVVYAGVHGIAALKDIICSERGTTDGPLLYIRGRHVAGNLGEDLLASGYQVVQQIVYEAVESTGFSPEVIENFQNNFVDGVLLFSPRTATVFFNQVKKAGLIENLGPVTFYCLSQNVSDSIELEGTRFRDQVVIAEQPTQESLISSIGPK